MRGSVSHTNDPPNKYLYRDALQQDACCYKVAKCVCVQVGCIRARLDQKLVQLAPAALLLCKHTDRVQFSSGASIMRVSQPLKLFSPLWQIRMSCFGCHIWEDFESYLILFAGNNHHSP